MTATIKGRVLDYAGRPVESSFTLAPIGAPKALSSQTILTAGVLATSTRNGSLSATVSAGEYTLTLHSGVCLTADVALNSGEVYGLATLLGVNGDDSYGIIISDDGDVMTIPDSYLVDEDGDRYQLGGVQAYTVEGTDAQIFEAVGSKVEDIASARLEELVKVEIEESAGPIIEAAMATEVEPVRGDLATLSGEVSACEGQVAELAGRVANVELDVAGVEEDLTYHEESLKSLRTDVNSNASNVAALESRTTALESWKTTTNSRLAAVEAREDKDTVYDDTALRLDVEEAVTDLAVLEGRVDALEAGGGSGGGEAYDDTELRGLIAANATAIEAIEEVNTEQGQSLEAVETSIATHDSTLTKLRTDVDAASSLAVQADGSASDALSLAESHATTIADHETRLTNVEAEAGVAGTAYALATDHESRVDALEATTESNTSRIGLLEQQVSTAVVSVLKLGADEEIPADTPAGTLVVRVTE